MFASRNKAAIAAACLAALLLPLAASGAADKQLQRQKGAVSYVDAGGTTHSVSGEVVLSDNSTAVTGRSSLALLAMPDSSEISIGENTRVKVGAFNDATSTAPNTITVEHGAMRFAIRHPSGAKSNYQFVTPTSQIAVRGTEGYLVVGDKGTQVVCTKCEPGDVTVTVAGVITALVTGQVFTVLGPAGATTTSAGTVSQFNNPAVNQFSNGANPFGNAAASSDVTGSASGVSAGASAGVSAGAVAGGAVVTGAAVAAVASQPSSAPPAGPTSAPITIGPSSITLNRPGDSQNVQLAGAAFAMSQNPSIATVMSTGSTLIVRAVGSGSTLITVTGAGWTRTINVTVMSGSGIVH